MVYLVCPDCRVGLRIGPGELGEFEGLFEVRPSCLGMKAYPCFRCELEQATLSTEHPDDVELFDVNPQEAFAAINGLGLPSEQECNGTAVADVFLEKKVKHVTTRMIRNSHRCILDNIEFDDGTKMYFGASAGGAIVYRIAPRHSYAQEVDGG
jgi:hypothetical protein